MAATSARWVPTRWHRTPIMALGLKRTSRWMPLRSALASSNGTNGSAGTSVGVSCIHSNLLVISVSNGIENQSPTDATSPIRTVISRRITNFIVTDFVTWQAVAYISSVSHYQSKSIWLATEQLSCSYQEFCWSQLCFIRKNHQNYSLVTDWIVFWARRSGRFDVNLQHE